MMLYYQTKFDCKRTIIFEDRGGEKKAGGCGSGWKRARRVKREVRNLNTHTNQQQHRIAVFNVKVTAKVQYVNECLSDWYLLNHRTFCHKIDVVMKHHEPECCAERKKKKEEAFSIFKVKVTARAHMIKCSSFYCIFWTADSLATKLGVTILNWILQHHKMECAV